ncbi:LAFE_0G15764g1_1 [Lachancea fermentati]|uniref:LAFE_0G15764g1_1 n=1 Tax=Lachancea fermentati TaxID=4955 RepID=A0A1G4MIM5_LACFM|nr:LAFE_0G15764g1_1 [Lachancea fermentati]
MRALYLLLLFSTAVFAGEIRVLLFAQKLGEQDKAPFATLVYDQSSSQFEIVDVNENLEENSYCIGAEFDGNYYSCFSYIKVKYPLHYDLFIDTRHDSHLLYKLSLKPNLSAKGINPVLREPVAGPEASAIKLKKVTKTYEDKKSKLGSPAASFEEDIEPDERTFVQKNWKYMLIGLVLYTVISGNNGGSTASQQ